VWKWICLSRGLLSFLAVLSLICWKVIISPFFFEVLENGASVSLGMLFSIPLSMSLIRRILGSEPFSGWLTDTVLCSRSMSFHSML